MASSSKSKSYVPGVIAWLVPIPVEQVNTWVEPPSNARLCARTVTDWAPILSQLTFWLPRSVTDQSSVKVPPGGGASITRASGKPPPLPQAPPTSAIAITKPARGPMEVELNSSGREGHGNPQHPLHLDEVAGPLDRAVGVRRRPDLAVAQ